MTGARERLALARQIFTAEEQGILFRYEMLSLFEMSKRRLEWFVYGLVVLIWMGVAACLSTVSKLSNPAPYVHLSVPHEQTVKMQYSREKVCEEIKKVSLSKLPPEVIFRKIEKASNEWGLDEFFVMALVEKECNFKENAVARDHDRTGSVGWSQASDKTWDHFNAKHVWPTYKEAYPYSDRTDPDKSLEFIGWYLTYLKKHYPDIKTLEDLYAAYNGGPGGIHKSSARANAEKCMEMYRRYRLAYLNN